MIPSIMDTQTAPFREALNARMTSVLRSVEPTYLREALQHATHGGKQVRPLLTLLACSAAGGTWHRALDAATAIELLHTSSLIHDDLMDESPLRRGVPTLHTIYNIPTAILAGDTLIALAFELVQGIDVPTAPEIARVFSRAFQDLCEGQAYDLAFSSGHPVDPSKHRVMVEKKTAALFRAAGEIGALHATDDRSTIRALSRFAYCIGMAFQAQDDLLDAVGDEATMGKPVMLDRKNGKQTFYTLGSTNGAESSSAVTATVNRFTSEALEALADLPPSEAREVLTLLARSLESREC
jgi:geranylgeranyl pyrophosphate synthase